MTDLTADVNDNQVYWKVSDMPVADYLQADDEIVRIIYRLAQHEEVYIERGYAGTMAASHSSGELTTLWVPGAGGGEPQTTLTGASADGGPGGQVSANPADENTAGTATVQGGSGLPGKNGGEVRLSGGDGDGGSDIGAVIVIEGGGGGSDGRLELIGAEIAFNVATVPEVPASPTEQDIVDALVSLGLVTQAS